MDSATGRRDTVDALEAKGIAMSGLGFREGSNACEKDSWADAMD